MDLAAGILAKRYARAYLALDGKRHTAALEAAAHEKLEGLRKVYAAARPHMKTLTHPAVTGAVKLEVLKKLLGPGVPAHAADFAALLVRRGRFGLLDGIMESCLRLTDAFSGIVRAEVYSRYPLSAGELARIEKMIACVTGHKAALRTVIAERVLGGFEIKVGDTLIDATVKGRLEALRAGLLKG